MPGGGDAFDSYSLVVRSPPCIHESLFDYVLSVLPSPSIHAVPAKAADRPVRRSGFFPLFDFNEKLRHSLPLDLHRISQARRQAGSAAASSSLSTTGIVGAYFSSRPRWNALTLVRPS